MTLPTRHNPLAFSGASGSYTPASVADSVLVVVTYTEDLNSDSPITAVTFGGVALTKITEVDSGASFSALNRTQIWYLVNPGTTAQTIALTGGESGRRGFVAVTLGGVKQTTPVNGFDSYGGFGTDVDLSVGVTTTVDDCIIVSGANHEDAAGSFTVTGATEDIDAAIDGDLRGSLAYSTQAIAGAVTHNHDPGSGGRYSTVLAAFEPAGSGATLQPNNAAHGQSAAAATFSQTHALIAIDAGHGHTAGQGSFAQLHDLTIAPANHGHTAAEVVLAATGTLDIQGAAHAHTADAPGFGQAHLMAPQSAASAHLAAVAGFITQSAIVIDGAVHVHTAEVAVLFAGAVAGVPPERLIVAAAASNVVRPTTGDRAPLQPGADERTLQGKR